MPAQQIVIVYATYLVATFSPGPSNMAIMATAMRDGRRCALALAAGVVTGSLFWALVAAAAMSAVLTVEAQALSVLKIAGGAYLIYLAVRAGRSALRPGSMGSAPGHRSASRAPCRTLYGQGVLMHMGNPKAMLAWLAILSLGVGAGVSTAELSVAVGGCALIGILVFGGYALLFSTAWMIALYARCRRWIEGTLAVVFAAAGMRLLWS